MSKYSDSTKLYASPGGKSKLLFDQGDDYSVADEEGFRYGFEYGFLSMLPKSTNQLDQVSQAAYQQSIVSSLYAKGYRQAFSTVLGFPGMVPESIECIEYFARNKVGTMLDLSCGPGVQTVKFIASKKFNKVISGDYSSTMLQETLKNVISNGLPEPELVRLDAAELPFQSNCLDGIYAGAAMHCWPRIETCVREIYRVLKPGGVYYGTTIMFPCFSTFPALRQFVWTSGGFFVYNSVKEVKDMFEAAGFQRENVEVRQEGWQAIVIKAKK